MQSFYKEAEKGLQEDFFVLLLFQERRQSSVAVKTSSLLEAKGIICSEPERIWRFLSLEEETAKSFLIPEKVIISSFGE